MSRKPFIAGNWKMNKSPEEAKAFVEASSIKTSLHLTLLKLVLQLLPLTWQVYLQLLKVRTLELLPKTAYFENAGAFTGETSPQVLKEIGTDYVVIGHSERRDYFHETDEDINKKQKQSLLTVCFQSSVVVKALKLTKLVKQQNS